MLFMITCSSPLSASFPLEPINHEINHETWNWMFVEFDTWIIAGWWEKIFVETIRDLRLVGKQYETWVGEAPPQAWHVFCQLLTSICPAKKLSFLRKVFWQIKTDCDDDNYLVKRSSFIVPVQFPGTLSHLFLFKAFHFGSDSLRVVLLQMFQNWLQIGGSHLKYTCVKLAPI